MFDRWKRKFPRYSYSAANEHWKKAMVPQKALRLLTIRSSIVWTLFECSIYLLLSNLVCFYSFDSTPCFEVSRVEGFGLISPIQKGNPAVDCSFFFAIAINLSHINLQIGLCDNFTTLTGIKICFAWFCY